MFKFLAVAAVLVVVEAIEPYGHQAGGHGGYHAVDYYTEPHYSFVYEVKDLHTHDIKSHKEERKGDHTQGVYELIEPDGSKRTVEYIVAGKSGFNAVVHREHSKHPASYGKGGYGGAAYYGGSAGGYGGSSGGYGGSSGGYSGLGGGYGGYSGGHGGATSFALLSTKGSLGGGAGGFGSGGYSSGAGGYNQGSSGYHTVSYSSLGGAGNSLGGYKGQSGQASYGGSLGGGYGGAGYGGYGDATSSVKFSTHGAHIAATTHHIIPVKHHY